MKIQILKSKINVTKLSIINKEINKFLKIRKKSFYICVSAVHSTIEAFKNKKFEKAHNHANFAVPDGRPLFWFLNLKGYTKAEHIPGYKLTHSLLKLSEVKKYKIGIYGSKNYVIKSFKKKILNQYEKLNIVFDKPHPHSKISKKKHNKIINEIKKKNVDILFVCLGCPLQEVWMYENSKKLNCAMIGIGAAIDFISGNKRLAPKFMENIGLAWLFRLASEPKRLFWRYFSTNILFIVLIFLQVFGFKNQNTK